MLDHSDSQLRLGNTELDAYYNSFQLWNYMIVYYSKSVLQKQKKKRYVFVPAEHYSERES